MDKATLPITVTKFIEAPAQRIYDAWLIPANASKWLFATPTGEMVRAEIEPRVGGKFTFTDRRDGQDVEHVGEFLELEPARKLAFKFKVPKYSDEYSTIKVVIFPAGGGCKVTITAEGVLAEWAEQTKAGWLVMLEKLAKETED